jgi:hypothetical protein
MISTSINLYEIDRLPSATHKWITIFWYSLNFILQQAKFLVSEQYVQCQCSYYDCIIERAHSMYLKRKFVEFFYENSAHSCSSATVNSRFMNQGLFVRKFELAQVFFIISSESHEKSQKHGLSQSFVRQTCELGPGRKLMVYGSCLLFLHHIIHYPPPPQKKNVTILKL